MRLQWPVPISRKQHIHQQIWQTNAAYSLKSSTLKAPLAMSSATVPTHSCPMGGERTLSPGHAAPVPKYNSVSRSTAIADPEMMSQNTLEARKVSFGTLAWAAETSSIASSLTKPTTIRPRFTRDPIARAPVQHSSGCRVRIGWTTSRGKVLTYRRSLCQSWWPQRAMFDGKAKIFGDPKSCRRTRIRRKPAWRLTKTGPNIPSSTTKMTSENNRRLSSVK